MTPPARLNYRYKILKALAEGGFGKTFLAEDTQMPSQRRCVIKQLKPVSSRPELAKIVQQRFTREAAVLDTVGKGHSQIPTLYAYFVIEKQFYLVQEWIQGEPLQVAAHAVWTEENVRQLLRDLLPAIAHVHSKNVIHRDIKPDNIIIRNADHLPCLIDFGAVKELMSTVVTPSGMPKSSIVIGTAGYMSPEQAAGHPTFSSDLYSLGMTAIGLLTGRTPAELPSDSLTGQLLWQQYAPTVSAAFAQHLSKAIHIYPQHRYHAADEMLAALSHPAVGLGPDAASVAAAPTAPAPTPGSAVAHTVVQGNGAAQAMAATPTPDSSFVHKHKQADKAVVIAVTALMLGAAVFIGLRFQPDFKATSSSPRNPTSITPEATSEATSEKTIESTDKNASNASTSVDSDISEPPETAAAFMSRAQRLYRQGRLAQAQQDVAAALALEPDTVPALTLKGDILVNQSRIDLPGAIAAYTQALRLVPNDISLLDKRCKAHADNKSWTLAEQDCTQLLSLDPSNASIYDRRGDIRSAQANHQAAIEDYTQAIALNEAAGNAAANQSIYFSRAHAYSANGDPTKALEDFEKFQSL